jgi:3-hydroxymyristoyl/3-hydroxydecanoyl-(acyl carrier protein) dehydratase
VKYYTQIEPNHPALEGHFPGNPVVPGVVILDQVIVAFKKEHGDSCAIHKIPSVKFLSPLKPGVRLEFTFDISNDLVHFTGECGEKTIVSGQLELSPVP